MGAIIAVNGKGGTGKSSIAALLAAHVVRNRLGSILAVDADPNSCLADNLGVKDPQTIVGLCDEISGHLDKIPAGMTKDRFIEMRVQEAVNESNDIDLLVMGRPEGPGCYCYVNSLLRNIVGNITKGYDFVIIDNAAGMEHISRRTTGEITRLLVISDYSVAGLRGAKRIYALAKQLGIKIGAAYLIMNKVSGPLEPLRAGIDDTGLGIAGSIPYDAQMVEWNVSNKSVFDFQSIAVEDCIKEIFDNITKGSDGAY